MTKSDWNISKSNYTCGLCDLKLREGEIYFSTLDRIEDGFHRLDFCPSCFKEHRPGHVFSFWKTTVPLEYESEKDKRPVIDIEFVLDFFRRLEGDQDLQKISFRFVLALMLTRKKVLDLKGSEREKDGSEVLIFSEKTGKHKEEHRVIQPDLNEAEIGAVSEELGQLLGIAPPPTTSNQEEPVAVGEGLQKTGFLECL